MNRQWLAPGFIVPQRGSSRAGAALPPADAFSGKVWLPGSLIASLPLDVLDQFFTCCAERTPGAPPALPGRLPNGSQPETEGETPFLPPLYFGGHLPPVGKPIDPVAAGYLYLCNYARQSIHAAERRVGPLHDHDDIVQQICVEWLERAGPPDGAFPRLLDKAPAEMQLLRETVHRVITRITYQQRKGPGHGDLSAWPAPERPAERVWMEFKSDCARGVGRLTEQEWQVLELRRQGYTFAEIGFRMAVPRQRVWEVYHDVVARLQHIYGSAGGEERP
jgi:DNA-directed RNA polymerase specialized sigma24 family protein